MNEFWVKEHDFQCILFQGTISRLRVSRLISLNFEGIHASEQSSGPELFNDACIPGVRDQISTRLWTAKTYRQFRHVKWKTNKMPYIVYNSTRLTFSTFRSKIVIYFRVLLHHVFRRLLLFYLFNVKSALAYDFLIVRFKTSRQLGESANQIVR